MESRFPKPTIDLDPDRWEELARNAYQAYGKVVDFKNYQGYPMPEWGKLPLPIQLAWIAAAMQVAVDFKIRPIDAAASVAGDAADEDQGVGGTDENTVLPDEGVTNA